MSSSDEVVRVVACVIRRNTSIDLGITFRHDVVNGCLVIDSIAANSPFSNTGLKLDQQLVKLNGHRCFRISKSKLEMTEMRLKQAKGIVTIEAQTPNLVLTNNRMITEHQVFTIQKASKSFQLGLGLEKIQTPEDSLRIVKVSPTFQKVLGLTQGLQLVSVNDIPCNVNDIDSVHEQMREAFPLLSLGCIATAINPNVEEDKAKTAEKKEEADENLRVIACVLRTNVDLDLGISFRRGVEDGDLEINSVSKSGFFGKTALRPGLRVVRLNGHRIKKKHMDQAVGLLQQARGLITIEVYKPASTPSAGSNTTERQVFCIQKANKSFEFGIGLERIQTPSDTVVITKVSQTFQKVLGLRQGLQLVKVNGEKCDPFDIESVNKQMSEAFPMLTLDCIASVVNKEKVEEEEEDDENVRVVACVVRPNGAPLGVSFHPDSEMGCLAIDSVNKFSIFAGTGLKAGQFIVRINGKRITQNNVDQAQGLLEKIAGRVTLEAVSIKDPEARRERRFLSIQKTSKSLQIDIGMGAIQLPHESKPSLRVLEVPATFQKLLGLLPGLQLMKINGTRCNMNDIPSIYKQMDKAFPIMTLECIATFLRKKDDDASLGIKEISVSKDEITSDDVARVVACVTRADPSTDLGLTFTKDIESGRLVIDSVAVDGMFAGTGLAANQRLIKINGKRTPKRKLDLVLESLQQAKGRITLETESIAIDPQSTSERLVFSIQKPHKKFQLGLGLAANKTEEGSSLRIVKASATLERVLGLKQGLQLAKINGVACKVNDIQAVHKQMDEAFPILSLECVAAIERVDMQIKRVDSDLTAGSSIPTASSTDQEEEARLAAEAKADEEARIKAELELMQRAEEEAQLAAELRAREEEVARLKAEEEACFKTEQEAKLKAEEEARIASEEAEAARQKAEQGARLAAEAEAARQKAEEEAKAKAEEEVRLKVKVEAKAEEESRLKAEEEARKAAEEAEAARLKAEEETRQAAEAEAARLKAEEEARIKTEAEAKAKAEAESKAKAEEEARKKAQEEFRQRMEEETRKRVETEAKANAAEEARLKAEEEARQKAEETFRLRAEEAGRRQAAQEAKEKAQEEARLKAYQESRVRAEEEALLWEEASKQADEEAKKVAEEEEKRKERREARIAKSRNTQKQFGAATGGDSGFGFFSSGLNAPLIRVKEKTVEEDEDALLMGSIPAADSGMMEMDEVDDLIRAAEERQAKIEKELLDLVWD